jgi:RNA polymerase sigma-70 factor (ECF subfamily)
MGGAAMNADSQDFTILLCQIRTESNPAARGSLLDRYRNYLELLAELQLHKQLLQKLDPSDLVQETFLDAHRDFSSWRGQTEAELIAWLRNILAKNIADQVRRYVEAQNRNVHLERDITAELDRSSHQIDNALIANQSSPSQQAIRRERAVLFADALAKLAEDRHAVVISRIFEGLEFKAIAARMGRSVDSVEKLWVRALVDLRPLMDALQ